MNQNEYIADIDDATKCPCIGSIFVAGVSADEKTIAKWKKYGVKDSKLLTRKKREEFALIIKQSAAAYTIHEITPAMIDDKHLNLNTWQMLVLFQTMHNMQQKKCVEYMYVDNWEVSPRLFWKRFKQVMQFNYTQYLDQDIDTNRWINSFIMPEHKADEKYTIVAAASILAKTASDFQYDAYKITYGDFGSGSPGDPKTRQFVWRHRNNPPPIIRTSWKTYKVLCKLDSIEQDPLAHKRRRSTNATSL